MVKSSKIKKSVLLDLYCEKKFSLKGVGDILGCCALTVKKALGKHNIRVRSTGESRINILVDKTFGSLYVKSQEKELCTCVCICGNITKVKNSSLLSKNTSSCGCSHNKCGNINPTWAGYERIPKTFFTRIKYSANKRHLKFDIKIEDIWNMFVQQNRKCALSGIELNFDTNKVSIDRINSSIGYTTENCWIVYPNINIIKYTHSIKTMYYYIDHILFSTNTQSNTEELNKKYQRPGNFTGYKLIEGAKWLDIINSAKRRNLDFSINIKDVWKKFVKQGGNCALSKLPITLGHNIRKGTYWNASLDRIDSDKGYIKNNVQWIHKDIQRMKWQLSEPEFLYFCKSIYNNKNVTSTLLKDYYHVT